MMNRDKNVIFFITEGNSPYKKYRFWPVSHLKYILQKFVDNKFFLIQFFFINKINDSDENVMSIKVNKKMFNCP